MIDSIRLGVRSRLECRPVIHAVKTDPAFTILADAPIPGAEQLRDQLVSAALMTPLEYAKDAYQFEIIPHIGVSSPIANDAITLHFKEGIHTITTLAVDPSCVAEIILAKIILAEEFDTSPRLVPVQGPMTAMLSKADAALLVGEMSVRNTASHVNKLDLIEAWNELTRTPFVHAIWVGRAEDWKQHHIDHLQKLTRRASEFTGVVLQEAGPEWAGPLRDYLASLSFEMSDEEEAGITEYFRYAYYHGVLPDIPDLHFLGSESEGESPDLDIFKN